jgi:ribosomal protein S18 acetylase RimI-like enzyme
LQINNLVDVGIKNITNCFNAAFSDYIIKVKATEEYLEHRWKGAGVNLELSFGAFEKEKIVGFIIHGIDMWKGHKTAFNVGTGVIPEKRGRKIVKSLYKHAFPILEEEEIRHCRLEVIQENKKAIKAYKSVGFKEERELISFTYKEAELQYSKKKNDNEMDIKTHTGISEVDWDLGCTFWDYQPPWEHTNSSLKRLVNDTFFPYKYVEIQKNEKLIGYAIINPNNGYIPQFAIAKGERNQGNGRKLFNYLASMSRQLSVINVDSRSETTQNFLTSFGFQVFISQYEMALQLPDDRNF